jgi:hypothetical protein
MKKITLMTTMCLLLTACGGLRPVPTITPAATDTPAVQNTTPPNMTPTEAVSPTPTADPPGIPNFDHIIMIVLENRDYSNTIGNEKMPFLNELAGKYVLLSDYYALTHPSLPNYIALMSGDTQNITSDCHSCFVNQPNLADSIEASGRSWKAYLEGMPSSCFLGDQGEYAQKHNPLLYFDSIRLDANRCQKSILPLTALETDLAANQLPNFSFIMPDLCNSGHDCTGDKADNWVKNMVGKLQSSPALGSNSLIIVTFDEASTEDTSSCCGMGTGGGKIYTVLVSPSARAGFTDSTPYSHYSLLKTILTAWDLPALGKTSDPVVLPIEKPWEKQNASSSSSSSPDPGNNSSGTAGQSNISLVNTTGCASGSPASGGYTAKVCLSYSSDGQQIRGDVGIEAKVEITGNPAKIQRAVFYLDGTYLLTAFDSPYKFILPTAKLLDGSHTLSVEAIMRDQYVTPRAEVSTVFNNGVTSLPVNNKTFEPSTGTAPVDGKPFTVVVGGDGAGGRSEQADVVDLISSLDPNLFLYLGDVYDRGSLTEFYNWYGSGSTLFGQFRDITNPTIGNHEYLTDNGSAYFNYWNNIPDYYSFNANGWHFISLNSNDYIVPTAVDSEQYKWLQEDLATNKQPCTIAYYHHPLFNIGPEGSTPAMTDIWKLLADNKVSIVLNGHDHDYQRWMPLDGAGEPSPTGVTEFVVGSSGHGLQSFTQTDDRLAYSNNSNPTGFGVLQLQLNRNGANFSYRSIDKSVLDSGVIPCAGGKADVQGPSTVTGVSATILSDSRVDLTWPPANDDTGVAGYAITRNGLTIATVPAYEHEYSDTNVSPAINYTYSITAFDLVGQRSESSGNTKVLIPGKATFLTFTPEADAYVSSAKPDSKYGNAPFLRTNSSPEMNSYLRFKVSGLAGRPIARVRLLIFANNKNSIGFTIYRVGEGKWDEKTITYSQAPGLSGVIASSGPTTAGTWITVEVTDFITGEGTYTIAITTTSTRTISLASRESGINAPQLIVDFK